MIEGGKEMEEINLESLIESIWSRKIWIIIIVCISLIIGWYYSYFMITPEYQSFTTLLLAQNTTNSDGTSGQITQTDITLNQKLISTYSALIKTKDVLEQVIQNLEIDITQEELKNNISVSAVSGTELIKITVKDENPENAAKIADEIANVFKERIAKDIYNINNIHIVEKAEVSNTPSNINHKKDLVFALGVGLVIVAIYIFIATLLDNTIKSIEEAERDTGIMVLGTIPKAVIEEKGGKRYE